MFTLLIGILFVALPTLPAAAEPSASVTAAINSSPPSFELSTSADETIEKKAYHVPVLLNDSVEAYIEYFRTRGKSTFQRWLDNSAPYLHPMKEIFREENLPEELAYVAMIESGFDPGAVSVAKAAGLWQFMPDTARRYGLRSDRWIDERRDHIKSAHAAAQHFRDLHSRFGSWPLVLAAYNAGTAKVQRAMLRTGSTDFWDLKESAYLRRETKSYVPKFMAAVLIARDPVAYGFRVPDVEPLRYDEVVIPKSTDLGIVAYCIDSTYEMIKSLNPEIQGGVTPPDDPRYLLKIPEGKKKIFLARRTAIRGAALRIPWEEKVSVPFPHQIGPGREVSSGPDPCSLFEKKVDLEDRSYRPVAYWSSQDSEPVPMGKDVRVGTVNRSTARAGQTQPAGLHQYLGPWALPFLRNVTDRRRSAPTRAHSCSG
ncbi:MAG TPA: lytic transglycosylase domain-containing protein [Thermodesulfovibrionales bacterium]|nr:lytic transglycosylase domain-containing protein [Thermodesulfovibrionales bacterium]